MNILAACTLYEVDLLKLSEEMYDKLSNDFSIDADCTILTLSEEDIYKYEIPYQAVNLDSCQFDEDELAFIMEDILGNYPHYLVFASGCKWNGSNGYKIVEDITETCYRDYDISLSPIDKGRRKASFLESSHDVPTGSTTYMIGITDEEYDKLANAEFEEVESFVNTVE